MSKSALLLLSVVVIATGACGEERYADAESKTCRAHGALTDLEAEAHYSASYLHRWATSDNCAVRLDVLMTRGGEDACGDAEDLTEPAFLSSEALAEIVMGSPLGVSHEKSHPRQFIRDPSGVITGRRTSEAFDANARLPHEAKDTGFRQDGYELWMRRGSDRFIYLVDGDHVEAWPLVSGPRAGCA